MTIKLVVENCVQAYFITGTGVNETLENNGRQLAHRQDKITTGMTMDDDVVWKSYCRRGFDSYRSKLVTFFSSVATGS